MNFLLVATILVLAFLIAFLLTRFKLNRGRKALLSAVVISGVFNLIMTYVFTGTGVLSFGDSMTLGFKVAAVPVEQLLMCFLLPYAFLAIYLYLNGRPALQKPDKYSLSISNVLMGLSIAMIFFAYNKALAAITFSLMLLLLFFIEYRSTLRFMLLFYRAYLFALILFLLIFVPLHYVSFYKYALPGTIELKLAYIPFEVYFYFFTIGLLAVFSYERVKHVK
jgi:hypothetical protein